MNRYNLNQDYESNTLISLPFIPIYIAIMIRCEIVYFKIAAFLVLSALFIGEIIQTKRAIKKGIIISKK